jgi:transcriptional regulator with XRE-family HTH domain
MLKEKIIHNIKTIRESKNITAEHLAGQLGVSQSTYSRKENGDIEFSLPELVKVSEALEVPLVKIIDLDLAKVINQNNHDTASGNQNIIENQTVMNEGYQLAAEQFKEENIFLKQQVKDLMAMLAAKI